MTDTPSNWDPAEAGRRIGYAPSETTDHVPFVREAHAAKPIWREIANRVLHVVCRLFPGGSGLRLVLHRLRGIKIGRDVFIGEDVFIETSYPEAVEIHDGVQISLRSTLVAHTHGEGRIVMERNAYIGAGTIIVAPAGKVLVIGEGAVVTAGSIVTTSVPPFTMYSCERAKPVALVGKPYPLCSDYMEFVRALRPLRNNLAVNEGSKAVVRAAPEKAES